MVQMEYNSLRDKDPVFDLELGCNGLSSEEEGAGEPNSKNLLDRVWNGFVSDDGLNKNVEAVGSGNRYSGLVESQLENGDVNPLEKKTVVGGEKTKKKSAKKPPKPPRPPRAPSMDAADQKILREMSEIAMLKRARIERMKALKRMKNAKSSSSNNNLFALIVTILFCFVIVWQGFSPRGGSSSVSFQGSPVSSTRARAGFISVKFYKNASTDHDSDSASPNNVELVSGLDDHGKASRSSR